MNNYEIFVDVSADLDMELVKACGAHLISMEYILNGETVEYTGENYDYKAFYDMIEHNMPTTSQISPAKYEEIFAPYLEKGISVLYLGLSSGLSSTFQSSKIAAEDLKEKYHDAAVFSVDTRSVCSGLMAMLKMAYENKEKGMSAEENLKDIEARRFDFLGFAFVENLMHLVHGGRLNAVTGAVGTVLNLKPLIELTTEGKLEQCGLKRGTKKAAQAFIDMYKEKANFDSRYPVFIDHSENLELAQYISDGIRAINPKAVVKNLIISPIIGVHLGQKSIVMFFEKKEGVVHA